MGASRSSGVDIARELSIIVDVKQAIQPPPSSTSAVARELDGAGIRFRSPLRYPGGKQKAIEQISRLLRSAEEYREPLVGGGSVYFHARSMGLAKRYWINDKFAELVAFWQTAQDPQACAQLVTELDQLRRKFRSAAQIKKFFLKARLEEPADAYRE